MQRFPDSSIVGVSAYRDPTCWRFRGVGGATRPRGNAENEIKDCGRHKTRHPAASNREGWTLTTPYAARRER